MIHVLTRVSLLLEEGLPVFLPDMLDYGVAQVTFLNLLKVFLPAHGSGPATFSIVPSLSAHGPEPATFKDVADGFPCAVGQGLLQYVPVIPVLISLLPLPPGLLIQLSPGVAGKAGCRATELVGRPGV